MRAREPDETGSVRGIHWERFGDGEPALIFVPPWSIVHSHIWKAQVPYFARHYRTVAYDPRGNGRSVRPPDAAAYSEAEFARDLIAVMDASATERAILVSLSLGAQRSLLVTDACPERVLGLVFVAPALPFRQIPERARNFARFEEPLDTDEGWAKMNAAYIRRDYRGFLEFFFSQVFVEPHSTKQLEDAVGYGLATDPETLIATLRAAQLGAADTRAICARVRCPVLVIHGEEDAIRPLATGEELAALTGGRLMRLPGLGHCPQARKPVLVNIALREFVEELGRSPPGSRRNSRSPAFASAEALPEEV
jgi:pimeloyl-ACP methyl ester carboxylesterase